MEWRQQKRAGPPAGLLAFDGGTTQHGSDDKEVAHGSAADVDNFFVQSGSAGGGRLPEPALYAQAGYHLRTGTTPMRSCTLWAGTRKVRGFATGQGRGWPWSKTPSCRRLRPGGANGKRCYEEPTEILNITSRCVRSGNRRRSRRPVTQCCVMLCSGFPAPTVVRSTDAARAFIAPPWGGWEGMK